MIDKQRLGTFVLGGAVGALVGILLTPRSGRELRGSIADRAGETRDRSRENYFETQERLRERLSEMGEAEPRWAAETEKVSFGSDAGPVEEETPFESDPSNPRLRGLRDVSREMREEPTQPENDRPAVDRSEELRRKVRETRERLRKRTEGPGGGQG
jgi:gas vesicle protein